MKKTLLSLVSALAFCAAAFAAEAWTTDYAAALQAAQKENKPVLVLFTGSDWCPPCMYMEKNVFPSKEFTEFADKNLLLVKLDFPRNKPQAEALRVANAALYQKFSIEGFPTMIIISPEGKELARDVGGSDAATFVAWLKSVLNSVAKKKQP